MSHDEQIRDVLSFMASHTHSRPLTYGEIQATYNRWGELTSTEKAMRWERCRRRFEAAQPSLAQKDRVRDAAEAVRLLLRESRARN
jgi:hypothetical protein